MLRMVKICHKNIELLIFSDPFLYQLKIKARFVSMQLNIKIVERPFPSLSENNLIF